MSKCPNCGRVLTCGCQKATAQNGAIVCNSCVASYNNSLRPKSRSTIISNIYATAKRIDNDDSI
jgi:DNA-directed RNA polymerase subunit M/transcription elongation factor TFIIS